MDRVGAPYGPRVSVHQPRKPPMQPISPDARTYDHTTIAFHWLTAILVITQWLGAQVIDWFPRGPLRVDARSVHIVMGVILAVLLVVRLLWRITQGRRLPPTGAGLLDLAGKAAHWGLYALMLAMVVVGMALTWARGDSIFNLFSIPAFRPGDRALADLVGEVHEVVGYLILALAGLHASAALVHRYLWQDGVLHRMLPWAKV
jgi:cytochrome b561